MVEQVLVLQLLRQFKTGSLTEFACALAVALDDLVRNHVASLALQVLQLIVHHPPAQNFKQPAFNLVLVEGVFATQTPPNC